MSGEERQRIDKWLVYARVAKSRALAARLVDTGHVRVNRDKISDPSRTVRPGDVLTIALDRTVLVWRVLALAARRGPAIEARALYEDLSVPAGAEGEGAEGEGEGDERPALRSGGS